MAFRDQILRCAATGKTFVWTVAEQRERVRKGLPLDPPLYCPEVRAADVRLAGDDADEPFEDERPFDAAVSDDVDVDVPELPRAAVVPAPPVVERSGARAPGPSRRDAGRGSRGGQRGGGRGARGGRFDGGEAPAQSELRIRHIGTVKWFDAERGFGFVVHEEGGELFLHGSSLVGDTVAALREGTPVEYEVVNTTRGKRAVDVVPLA